MPPVGALAFGGGGVAAKRHLAALPVLAAAWVHPPREVRSPWPRPPSCPPQELGHYGIEGTLTSPTIAQLEPLPGLPPGWGPGAGFLPCPLVARWLVMRGHSCPLSQNPEGAGQSTTATGSGPPDHLHPRYLWGNPAPRELPDANRAYPPGEREILRCPG